MPQIYLNILILVILEAGILLEPHDMSFGFGMVLFLSHYHFVRPKSYPCRCCLHEHEDVDACKALR